MAESRSERAIVLLVAAVQFVNILDFVMVMPMGPDFAKALAIPPSHLGYIGGAYTAAAGLSGIACSFFLDRFDRRSALGVSMAGLVVATAAGGLAFDLPSLLAARVAAGLFGGPATSVAFSIIADQVPVERRGRALGLVMGSFSVAAVVGVPIGLELARLLGWRAPFFAVAGLGLVVVALSILALPSMTSHVAAARASQASFAGLVERPLVLLGWLMTGVLMAAGFIIIPNISAYTQENLGWPREWLGYLYMGGGVISLVATQLGGRLVDRASATVSAALGCLVLMAATELGFVWEPALLGAPLTFALFMLGNGLRNVAAQSLATRIPQPHERARYMSTASAVQHFASAGGAFVSSLLLSEAADHKLVGMDTVGRISIALTAVIPLLAFAIERRLPAKGAPQVAPAPEPAHG